MSDKYPLHDFMLAVKILRHNRAHETVTFRMLLNELFPRSGRDIERNLDMLTELGMVCKTPEKLSPDEDYTLVYYVPDIEASLTDLLEKQLRIRFPEEFPGIA